jgi:hypothetical protein
MAQFRRMPLLPNSAATGEAARLPVFSRELERLDGSIGFELLFTDSPFDSFLLVPIVASQ